MAIARNYFIKIHHQAGVHFENFTEVKFRVILLTGTDVQTGTGLSPGQTGTYGRSTEGCKYKIGKFFQKSESSKYSIYKSVSDIWIPFKSSFLISVSGCKLTILPEIQPGNRIVIISGGHGSGVKRNF